MALRLHGGHLLWAITLLLLGMTGPGLAGTHYRIQLARYPDEGEAKKMQETLLLDGYGTTVEPAGEGWIVTLGGYRTYADAFADRERVRELLVPDAFIIREEREAEESFVPAPSQLVGIAKVPGAARDVESMVESVQGAELRRRVLVLLADGKAEEARADLLSMEELSDDDPAKGWALMRLAYLGLRGSEAEPSREYFTRVASGEVAALEGERVEALFRLGVLAHREKDHPAAWRLFRQVYHEATDEGLKAKVAMQLAALTMEFARSGRGTLAETRGFIQEQLVWINKSEIKVVARMELMRIESLYYEGLLDEFLKAVDPYLDILPPGFDREKATALCFKGHGCFQKGRFADSFAAFEEVLKMDIDSTQGWRSIPDFKEHSLRWLIHLSRQLDDPVLLEHYTLELDAYQNRMSAIEQEVK